MLLEQLRKNLGAQHQNADRRVRVALWKTAMSRLSAVQKNMRIKRDSHPKPN
jgi:hypothetical protein